ncbi:MAG TPA: substrate-binding domain-containing protein [Candidatus Acidoferrum sp.]|nr:substrate-binding domain-containing protein [Candidatus Acidoferrum sp.]
MIFRRIAAFTAVVAVVASACSSSGTPAPASAPASAGGGGACKVGVSWNNYQEERWAKWDEPAIKAALAAGGATYISNDAKSSATTQASNVDALISQGAKVVIILAQDGTAIKPSVTSALAAGVPVIAYDRLIEDPHVFYLTFDNVLVGNLQATSVFAAAPTGTYAVIKGNKADANADFLRSGMDQVIKSAVTSGAIKIPAGNEVYTDNWDPKNAQTEMEQILTANNNKIDAVLSENDGMAGGVVAALAAQGLAGKVPVSGQDGDAAALNRIALGTQTVDVWKDSRMLGKAAGDAAVALCSNPDPSKVAGAAPFTTPGGNTVSSILLKPDPITKANLKDVLNAGWITKADLCKGVAAGSVPDCN